MRKLIVGVAGSGKTTYLANEYKNNNWSIYEDTIVTGMTNATIKAFLSKIKLKKKQYGARTVYGLAYMELYRNGDITEEKERMLDYEFQKKYLENLSKRVGKKLTFKTLEVINNVFLQSILKYKSSERYKEFKYELFINGISLSLANMVYDDYKRGEYYSYAFVLEEALKKGYDFFNIYQMHIDYNFGEALVSKTEAKRIIIDEFQDFPRLLTEMVLNKFEEVYFAGDPAQEIFSFYVPDTDYVISVSDEKMFLTKTNRFGKNIANLANQILREMGYNHQIEYENKKDWVLLENSSFKLESHIKNLYMLNNIKDVIILCRTREQVYELYNQLKDKFPIVNLEKYEYEKLSILLNLLKENKDDLLKTLESKTVLDYIASKDIILRKILEREGFDEEYIKLGLRLLNSEKWLFISTIHNVKGLEFDAVILYNKASSLIKNLVKNRKGFLSELKVFYTAITRAKKVLVILNTDDPLY